jgi:predicted small secreted protein
MKNKLLVLLAVLLAAVCFTGCASTKSGDGQASPAVQVALDAVIPADFTGAAHINHKNAWFDFEIKATGLSRASGRWTWTSLEWKRNGRFSTGWLVLTPDAK